MSSSAKYSILIWKYANRHFCKSYERKYKQAWDSTLNSIKSTLGRIQKANLIWGLTMIHSMDVYSIYKYEFKVAWSNTSAHSWGHRCILLRDDEDYKVTILLIYWKTNIKWSNETSRREKEIKWNYDSIKEIFNL